MQTGMPTAGKKYAIGTAVTQRDEAHDSHATIARHGVTSHCRRGLFGGPML
jgi:hypothetical protein